MHILFGMKLCFSLAHLFHLHYLALVVLGLLDSGLETVNNSAFFLD
jgi:hypothetical protein